MDGLATDRVRLAWELALRLLRGETVRFKGGGTVTPCLSGTGLVFWALLGPDGVVLETGDVGDIAIEAASWGMVPEHSEGAP